MRVLIVNKYVRVTGGADVHCLWLAACLRERGHRVAWLSTAGPGNEERAGAFVRPSVTHATRPDLAWTDRVRVGAQALWNRAAAGAMKRLLREFRPDVVSTHKLYPQLSAAPVVIAARAGVPVVQTVHDYELVSASASDHTGSAIDRDEDRWAFRLLNCATFPVRRWVHVPRLTACLSVSHFVASVNERHGIESTVVQNPAGRSDAVGTTPDFASRRGVVFAGRLSEEKGLRDVLAAARALPMIPFMIAGSGPLEALAREAAMTAANVTYLGWLDRRQLGELLAEARLTVLPSRWEEPSGLVALESLAVGTPFVTYEKGGLTEIADETGAGRIVNRSVEGLAAECRRLYEDARVWQPLSRSGIAAARSTWSAEAWGERMAAFLAHIAEAGRKT